MSGRGGRDRFRRRTPPSQPPSSSSARFSEKSRPVHPPSRHLWVGNLSNHVSESVIAEQFLRFGDLERVSYQPGRSYAFVNFRRDEDAIQAMNSLQGSSFIGASLKIEFAKADKMPAATRDDNYLHRRDEQRTNRNSPFSQRETRMNHGDHDTLLPQGSRVGDDTTESPSKVLWISYPTFLKVDVDETTLREAFSPFGEIENISVFQGRRYAFVRFRSLMSACRAKETLQGKLFGTPRVHISFARSEGGLSGNGRQISRINSPSNFRSTGRAGSSDDFQLDRNFRNSAEVGSSYFPSELDYGDSDAMSFGRNESLRTGSNITFEQKRIHDLAGRDGPEYDEFSPPKFPKRTPFSEEPWDSPEDPHLYHEAKKSRTALPGENELPEYRFSDSDRGKHSLRPVRDIPLLDEAEHLGFRRMPGHSMNVNRPYVERSDHLMPSRDSFQSASSMFSTNTLDQRRISPDLPRPSKTQEWKWEGTIAKGGNAICRARCLPVGKVLDFKLPELLDCTARTGLDMLAKHYYQASATWVVFFVPQSDADMSYYNEFMNYLGEKRRAAVAKLDDKNTLFLVPPSDFSEEVLKVPGKLSISGVVLRLEPPPTPTIPSLPPIQERKSVNNSPFHTDMLYPRSAQPARFSTYDRQRIPDSAGLQPNPYNPVNQEYTSSGYQRSSQDTYITGSYDSNRATVMPMADENKHSVSLSTSTFSGLQQDQLAQLASSLLGQQQRQPGSSSASAAGPERQLGFSGQSQLQQAQRYSTPVQGSQGPPGFSGLPQFQLQPQMQQLGVGSNAESAQGGDQEAEADPQKRLQATLQLAAALLQQIRQGNGP